MDALLLPAKEVVSVHFISFLLHQHPEYRQAVSQWKVQIKVRPFATWACLGSVEMLLKMHSDACRA